MVAVVPAAGQGSRMRGVTGGAEKELLPVGGRSVLGHVMREALACGPREVLVVSSKSKPGVEELVRDLGDPRARVVFQDSPRGLADAVARCDARRETVLALMGDAFYGGDSPSARLVETLEARKAWACVAVREVPREAVERYGVVRFALEDGRVTEVVEKPPAANAPSRWAVAGRFGFSPEAMRLLHAMSADWRDGREMTLSDLLREGLRTRQAVYAVPILESEVLFDCGSPEGYAEALEALGP